MAFEQLLLGRVENFNEWCRIKKKTHTKMMAHWNAKAKWANNMRIRIIYPLRAVLCTTIFNMCMYSMCIVVCTLYKYCSEMPQAISAFQQQLSSMNSKYFRSCVKVQQRTHTSHMHHHCACTFSFCGRWKKFSLILLCILSCFMHFFIPLKKWKRKQHV